MISVFDAKTKLHQAANAWRDKHRRNEILPLSQSLGRILAEAVRAPLSLPPFDNSAMDGFAVRAIDTLDACSAKPVVLPIAGDACAGDPPAVLPAGKAIRIMTGAVIPQGADTIIAKEDIGIDHESVVIMHPEKEGRHIRRRGEDITIGEEALAAGMALTPAAMAFLASLGLSHVTLARRPRVSILATGHELTLPGNPLLPGKIFDSNSVFLTTALATMHIIPHCAKSLDDQYPLIRYAVEQALADSDLVIISGGVSVGDYDHTRSVLSDIGAEELFWKVAQKPGKPLVAGQYKDALVLGLPGNPYAVAMCFYLYIRPLLLQMMGARDDELARYRLPLATAVTKARGRTSYLKGKILHEAEGLAVSPLNGQESHLMHALLRADCLIELSENQERVEAGEFVTVIQLS